MMAMMKLESLLPLRIMVSMKLMNVRVSCSIGRWSEID